VAYDKVNFIIFFITGLVSAVSFLCSVAFKKYRVIDLLVVRLLKIIASFYLLEVYFITTDGSYLEEMSVPYS
jgi:hypothetical protein